MKKWMRILLLVMFVLLVAIVDNCVERGATNFDECVSAGNFVMESYPRQCRDPVSDVTFVEEVEKWKLDRVDLMVHDVTGAIGCFGCSDTLCADPTIDMTKVEETAERYCSSEFEILGV